MNFVDNKLDSDPSKAYTEHSSSFALTFQALSCAPTLGPTHIATPTLAITCFLLSALIFALGKHTRNKELNS